METSLLVIDNLGDVCDTNVYLVNMKLCIPSSVIGWAILKIDNSHLCGIFSARLLGLQFTDCEWSMRGRNLEEPARGSGEVGATVWRL